MASSSSPPPRKIEHDVFLSFRGEDTRKNFIDHLYNQLVQKGICTFKDDEGLGKGQQIAKLLQIIKESRFAIVVFSKDYASSTWCLEEIATIMECQEQYGEEIVIPIFYDVEPTDVRHQKGSFAKSFAEHEKNFKDDKAKVERWRDALRNACRLSGHNLKTEYNGFEGKCVERVTNQIFTQLNQSIQASTVLQNNFVGLESRVGYVGNLLTREPDDVQFIGIWGMGGIGKTTTAMVVFNKFKSQFDGACSLANIRQDKIIKLQKTLLETIQKEKMEINDEFDGMEKIQRWLGRKKVLIVLDDVDQVEQLQNLAGDYNWFGRGSRVIITTRDAGVLRSHGVDEKYIYEVETLGDDEAIQLFNSFAFRKEAAPGVKQLSGLIVRYAMGLPLALKVLGSYLCGLKAVYWKNILVKLKDSDSVHTPKDKILKVLRISFDGLDPENQNVFLHIACFLRNWREEVVKDVVDSDLLVLIEKSLISVQNGEICMHDRIQEMGWHIASKESPRKMVWQLKDANDVLSRNMEQIEGIELPYWSRPHENNTFEITLRGMRTLKILIVDSSIVFRISEKYLPSSLRWLQFKSYHFDSLPESFAPPKLVGLSLRTSSLQNCRITQKLDNLTLLDLRWSKSLLETPDFDWMPNLRKLNLQYCMNLKVVHPSIGNLSKLVLLDLSECRNLESLPSFNQVSSLNSLNLCGCIELKNFPEIKERMPPLVELELRKVGIIKLPSSIQQLQGLTKLYLVDCEHLVCLSNGFCELKNLKVLVINRCTNLKSLPENLQSLNSLEYLNLNESYFDSFPESFNQLPRLQYLDIRNCENLKKLPKLPETTRQLYADSCFSYRRDIDELADFPELQSVAFSSSSKRPRYDFAEMCIHFPSRRKTPFSVTYPICYCIWEKINVLRIFQYRCYGSNGIAIDLNLGWNCQNFVGFAVCFLEDEEGPTLGLQSYRDIAEVDHCTIIVKLSCKVNKNEVLQRKCDIVKSGYNESRYDYDDNIWFAYIPFSGLWPAKSNSVTPNDFSRFEVNFMDLEVTAHWGCSLLYERSERPTSWDDSCEGSTTDIGPLDMLEYLNLSGKKFEHLPEDISLLCGLEYLDISGCRRLRRELPTLPPNIKELYASTYLASESNIVELATKYSKLYSVSFSRPIDDRDFHSDSLVPGEFAEKFIAITQPFLNRHTPFAVHYPIKYYPKISRCFKYTHHDPHKIFISLDPSWYSHNFVGFVVCFAVSRYMDRESHLDNRTFRYRQLITKLTHKDNGSELSLQTECVIGCRLYDEEFESFYSLESFDDEIVFFVYIPFSSLWPKSKAITDNTSPNHYLVFEATIQDLEFLSGWSCDLLYTDDKSLTEAIRQKREFGSSEGDPGEEGESIDGDEDVEYESDAGHGSGAAMAKHRAEMQTNEVRGIRFTSSGVKTCIGSPPTKKRTRGPSLTCITQKQAKLCISNNPTTSDSEYEANERNAGHGVDEVDSVDEEEGEDEQRKKAPLNKDKTPEDIIINSRKQNKGKNKHGELLVTKDRIEECIKLEPDYDIFHHSCPFFVMVDNIKDLLSMEWLDASIIQVFIMYLHWLCKESGVNSIGFMCPTKIAKAYVDMNVDDVIAYVGNTMANLQDKTFILAPYHQVNHWLLLVICTSSRMVYVLDPMQYERDIGIKPTLNKVFQTYANQWGQQTGHFVIGWKNIQCPQQPGSKECGYYVMRYMYEICTTYSAYTSLDEAFQEIEPYSKEKIDEIRTMWETFFTLRSN